MNNKTKYIFQYSIHSVATLMVTFSIIQAFMLQCGIPEESVTAYQGLIMIVNAGATLLLTSFIDRIKNVVKVYSYAILAQLLLVGTLIFFCLPFAQPIDAMTKFRVILAAGCITNITVAISGVLAYKIPYHIFNIAEYGDVTGKGGMVVGIVGAAVSALLAFFIKKYDYFLVMLCFLIFSAVSFIVTFGIIRSYTPYHGNEVAKKDEETRAINILTYKPFYILLVPNLLRAYSEGVALSAVTIGAFLKITDASSGAVMTTLAQIATLLGCFIFVVALKKISVGKLLLISSIGVAICMPLMYASGKLIPFYVLYFFVYFFVIIIQYAIPFAVTKIVDYDAIGQYTTSRMLLHTLGQALANFSVLWLIGKIGSIPTIILSVSGQVVCGLVYYLYLVKLKKDTVK